MLHVRKAVLGVSQAEMAAIANTSQGTVSKWEAEQLQPDRAQLALIREHVLQKGHAWDDSWFFLAPQPTDVSRETSAEVPTS